MIELTPDHLVLLREIAFSSAPYPVENAREWGDDGAEITATARRAEELAAAGLVRGIGQHFGDGDPGVYTVFEATEAGLAKAAG